MGSLSLGDRAARSVWRLVPKRALSGAIGWGARRELPGRLRQPLLARFARRYGIDVAEAEKPLADYAGIDDFFTRRLRAGARPVDMQPRVVVSPADGTVVESGFANEGMLIQAKGVLFRLDELVADAETARRLEGGAYLITYLSPRDYHRVHSPVAGSVVGWQHIPGTLFSVNAKSVEREAGLFARNERFVTLLQGEAGLCAVVMVAAVGVGHVTAAYDPDVATHGDEFRGGEVRRKRFDRPPSLARGDELGIFHLGSTTIVVFEPGRVVLDAAPPASVVRMGQRIGCILNPAKGSDLRS